MYHGLDVDLYHLVHPLCEGVCVCVSGCGSKLGYKGGCSIPRCHMTISESGSTLSHKNLMFRT